MDGEGDEEDQHDHHDQHDQRHGVHAHAQSQHPGHGGHERLRSRSPPPHHLPPPPPPPPLSDLRHFGNFSLHAHLHGQTSLNRASSPAHDLGYHTLVARSPAPPMSWSPNDLADLTLTPSPRYLFHFYSFICIFQLSTFLFVDFNYLFSIDSLKLFIFH